MCGILGASFTSANFEQALNYMNNRGPDFKNSIKINESQFGHTRLSIIDLSSNGNQPMLSENNRMIIAYNGETYNHTLKHEMHLNHWVSVSYQLCNIAE